MPPKKLDSLREVASKNFELMLLTKKCKPVWCQINDNSN